MIGNIIFIFAVLMILAWIEMHMDQINHELAINAVISESFDTARNTGRNPARFGSAGYRPQ